MTDNRMERNLEQDAKARKKNIYVMIILIVLFLIGILTRWDYVSNEIKEDVSRYINPGKTVVDTIKTE